MIEMIKKRLAYCQSSKAHCLKHYGADEHSMYWQGQIAGLEFVLALLEGGK